MLSGVRIYSPAQVAERTGFSKATILRCVHSGELKAIQVNARVIRIEEGDLARWLDLLRARATRMAWAARNPEQKRQLQPTPQTRP